MKISQSGKVVCSVPTMDRIMAKMAAITSGTISRPFLFQRSTKGPANGLNSTIGNMPSNVARLSTVAEPVCLVKYQIIAYCTTILVIPDKN